MAQGESISRLGMLASALSGRDIAIDHAAAGMPAWTNGAVIFVSGAADVQTQIKELCVQSALLAAGSLDRELVQRLARRPELSRRYLAVEGARVLAALERVLPPLMLPLIDHSMASFSKSPVTSLHIALSREGIEDPPPVFGSIRVRELLAARPRAGEVASPGLHIARERRDKELAELAHDADQDGQDAEDVATSPVGGGGGLGRLLQKMFQVVRQLKGGGPPGADAPTHWSRSRPRGGVRSLPSTATAEAVADVLGASCGILYPEWDVHRHCYRPEWCTVKEVDAPMDQHASVEWLEWYGWRRPLARLGMGFDRLRGQAQGDDVDIDAAVEAQVQLLAGTVPDEATYVESRRHRRDLSVLILLDISGSVRQTSPAGRDVHQQQREVAAGLATVLHEIGDRVALYAFHSQGRSAVHLVPVKRFDDGLDSLVMRRLHSLVPGAYSRLGAAIRHGATVLMERGGTSRRLLLVLSDGLAYDHGYEPAYGAADARQALAEARRDGVGCLCLSVGANTDAESLGRVFGSAAHAIIHRADQLDLLIGPLFRLALRSAELRRRAA
ncbi:MAG: VWA domain-containing protein [Nevskia sp.]|nr:VWA domain-containing protein [Nevskia sp.]